MRSIEKLVSDLQINKVDQVTKNFQLWWQPTVDMGREKYMTLFKEVISQYTNKRVLQIGYPWAGRSVPNCKVLDLYDPRPDIDYRVDACDMNVIDDNSFDLIICNSVLEHIPRFWKAAAEMQRVLDIGGLMWVAIPSVWPFHPESGDGGVNFGGDYWRPTHQGIEFLFSDHCEKVATWYIPAGISDDPRSGWGVVYLGKKVMV